MHEIRCFWNGMTVIFHFSWVLTVFARLAMNSTKKVLGNLDIAANVADISTLKSKDTHNFTT